MKAVRKFGWIPDVPDKRDHTYSLPVPRALAPSVNLTKYCSPVEDQGTVGSCTGNATVGALEFLMVKHKLPLVDLSRLFAYYNGRVLSGMAGTDSGAYIRNVIKTLKVLGVCRESTWPYDALKVTVRPTLMSYIEGLKYQIKEYERLNSVDEMRACLAAGYPFVFGFSVYESFMSAQVAKTGTAAMPLKDEKLLGGHAVCAVGYSDAKKRFTVRNSWGEKWGKKGYFTLPYAYLEDRNLSDDIWTIRTAEQM